MKFLLLALLSISSVAHARTGSFTGNGADRKGPGHGAAWFLGDRSVRWCGNHSAIQPALESALRKWAAYIDGKKIQENLRAPLPFALRFEKQSSCAGADLEIELSADPEAKVLSGSELLEQDIAQGWGKGRVWLSALLLSQTDALESQLLHQLGHILGHDHVGGTVMAEAIANAAATFPLHTSIDGVRELYLCRACPSSWIGTGGMQYVENAGLARILNPAEAKLTFTADLAQAHHGDAKLFTVAVGVWRASLTSQSLARLGLLELGGRIEQVIVRRNFARQVEIHLLKGGKQELIFETDGE